MSLNPRVQKWLDELRREAVKSRETNPNYPQLYVPPDEDTLFLRVDGSAVAGDTFSNYLVGRWLDDLQTTRMWAGLLTEGISTVEDLVTIEVGGSSYRRPELSVRRANPRLLVTDRELQWYGIPEQTTVFSAAIFDAPYNGNVLAVLPLPAPRPFPMGGDYLVPAGELFLGFR